MREPSHDEIRSHIDSIASRTAADVDRLAHRLRGRSWPGGDEDRREPIALGWLTRWRPSGPTPLPPPCGCAAGRCLVCN